MALNETALEEEAEKCCKRLIVQGAKGASGKYIRSKTIVNGRYACITILQYRYYEVPRYREFYEDLIYEDESYLLEN